MGCILIFAEKNYCWIWIAVDRERKQFLEVVTECRGEQTGSKLWHLLKRHRLKQVKTDYWKAYATFVPKKKHQASKAQTYTVEGYNSLLRHYLARLKRKTKCYSKFENMHLYSVILFFAKWNNCLSLLF